MDRKRTITTRRSRYTPGGFNLRVGKSQTGRGLFTKEDIPNGACIIEYTGRRATKEEEERDTAKYLFYVNRSLTINGNVRANLARFINHSCAPNCEALGPRDRCLSWPRGVSERARSSRMITERNISTRSLSLKAVGAYDVRLRRNSNQPRYIGAGF